MPEGGKRKHAEDAGSLGPSASLPSRLHRGPALSGDPRLQDPAGCPQPLWLLQQMRELCGITEHARAKPLPRQTSLCGASWLLGEAPRCRSSGAPSGPARSWRARGLETPPGRPWSGSRLSRTHMCSRDGGQFSGPRNPYRASFPFIRSSFIHSCHTNSLRVSMGHLALLLKKM